MTTHSHTTVATAAKSSASRLRAQRKQTESALVLTRIFNATQARVFRACMEPSLLKRWWAPKGWSTPYVTVERQVGGLFHYCMRSSDGVDIWGRGIFREIVEPRRITYIDSFSDEEGNLVEPEHYGMSVDHPIETQVTISFAKVKNRTKVTLRHDIPRTFKERSMMMSGWKEMFDRLAVLLAETIMEVSKSGTETNFTRLFAVPRDRLFKAWIDPELLAEWWGPHGFSNPVCTTDPQPGGVFHIVMRSPDGIDQSIKGQYLKVQEPQQIVFTDFIDEAPAAWLEQLNAYRHKGMNAPPIVFNNTLLLADIEGGTRLTLHTCFESKDDRDAIMKMGYAEGMAESLDRLEELFASCSMPGKRI